MANWIPLAIVTVREPLGFPDLADHVTDAMRGIPYDEFVRAAKVLANPPNADLNAAMTSVQIHVDSDYLFSPRTVANPEDLLYHLAGSVARYTPNFKSFELLNIEPEPQPTP